ncbi:hypothetical protein BOTBODRAFT_142519 [Botryobasidium botryosum FD-172 SS1]|uniref:Porphobilinogen deaminase n=1 Tax=Botryobasidium botryosum (strain FD-172 SS1) TaxID=930990 RepID=A0A067N7W0_BOTB1|nr:hypothetical protein BOTBODRAFT_142519 [Botryobasidium botryosum FD-172 SS1]
MAHKKRKGKPLQSQRPPSALRPPRATTVASNLTNSLSVHDVPLPTAPNPDSAPSTPSPALESHEEATTAPPPAQRRMLDDEGNAGGSPVAQPRTPASGYGLIRHLPTPRLGRNELAQIQTNIVRDRLSALHPAVDFSVSFMTTGGDKNLSQALYLLGGKSLWTQELEVALLNGDIDIIVHSLKDVPTVLPERCEIGAILEREDPSDSLVVKKGLAYKSLDELPEGSVVGTSSVRRVAQLKRAFPKLVFADVRGNLNTRLAKLDDPTSQYTALILAYAGLVRLGMGDRVTANITSPTLLHAVGQGALAVEIRSDDAGAKAILEGLEHRDTTWRCSAERACLRVLEGGCSVPVGVESSIDIVDTVEGGADPTVGLALTLTATVTSLTGATHVLQTLTREVTSRQDAEAVGESVARALIENGAGAILADIGKDRESKLANVAEVAPESHPQPQTQSQPEPQSESLPQAF